MKNEYLTPAELADLLRVPVSWVYAHVKELPVYRIGRLLRFKAAAIEEWLARQQRNCAEGAAEAGADGKPSGSQPEVETKATRIQ
jgi:excisionase family DNA binding protein